ncbi:hypothetical protein SAMN03159495_0969 [Pseudomonas sp. NFR16]|nr:hypothetical protein SAMN03159495_0969 [Pseudomonas sp. NFR16]
MDEAMNQQAHLQRMCRRSLTHSLAQGLALWQDDHFCPTPPRGSRATTTYLVIVPMLNTCSSIGLNT